MKITKQNAKILNKKTCLSIWLPWKREMACSREYYTKLLPEECLEKSQSSVIFASIFRKKKSLTFAVSADTLCPHPPPTQGRIGVTKQNKLSSNFTTRM